ncbi:MAG: GNAT family N-acetyltransferase [Acidimicrobiia bacterium]|nr:GNAT family N-acetyltransferase [Acidimicrobiia bacterium]
MSEVLIERGGPADASVVRSALYLAISWTGNPEIPPFEVAMEQPQIACYHKGWGRRGDIVVKAIVAETVVGAAFARRFTDSDHGHGFVDEATPELGIGVSAGFRRRGIGRRLMTELIEAARAEGIPRLSLSVTYPNPSRFLYESLGFRTVVDNGDSSIMVLEL